MNVGINTVGRAIKALGVFLTGPLRTFNRILTNLREMNSLCQLCTPFEGEEKHYEDASRTSFS